MKGLPLFSLIWELPQNLLGLGLLGFHHVTGHVETIERKEGRWLVEITADGAVSLGLFVFHTTRDNPFVPVGAENRDHEWGHALQSRMLGPLYLPIVGVPSVMRVMYAFGHRKITGRRWDGYYDGWPENAADRLGGVNKELRPKA